MSKRAEHSPLFANPGTYVVNTTTGEVSRVELANTTGNIYLATPNRHERRAQRSKRRRRRAG